MLNFQQISLVIGDKNLLQNCTATIKSGELIVLTGSSGSGKSLLLRILAGLITPTTGQLFWQTADNQEQNFSDIPPPIWRATIGFIQQTPELIDGTVLQNLQLPYTFKFYQNQKFNPNWHLARLTNLGKTHDFLQKSSATLSGGEKQLVNILRCLQLNPRLLLLDEPTSALDSHSRDLVENLVLNWQQKNPHRAMIWISHDSEQQQRFITHGATHWVMANGILQKG